MSRIKQAATVIGAIIAIGGPIAAVNLWYLTKTVPGIVQKELDTRDIEASENKPDEIVAALTKLSTQVEGLTTSQTQMQEDIKENFKWLAEQIQAL